MTRLERVVVPERHMQQSPLPPTYYFLGRVGAGLLAAALMATACQTAPAFAVEPTPSPSVTTTAAPAPSPTPGSTVAPTSTVAASASPSATATSSPAVSPSPTPSVVLDPSSASGRAAMAAAVGPAGAEMGQGSKRVASTPTGAKSLTTQSLSTEGTWSPTFGVQGLDVSGYQTSVNWQQQWNMGARFAYVKASEGNYFTNSLFGSQYQGARNVGMIRGAYHFAIPNWSSGADQARYFVQNGGGWSADSYTLPPVLDIEFNPYENKTINGFYFGDTCYGMSPSQLSSWVRDFGSTMSSLTGRLPVIYTNTSWWNQCLGNPGGFGDYPLWVASYPGAFTNNAGPLPSGSWANYSIWQYSSTGPLTGDSNVWNGSYTDLVAFANAGIPYGASKAIADVAAVSPGLGKSVSGLKTGLRGGVSQGFENGAIYWTAANGAHVSSGVIRDAWGAQGWEYGQLGYPTTDIRTASNGAQSQGYENGAIYWTAATGARVSSGPIRDAWAAQGWETGPLGYPTTDIRTAANGAQSQGYQNGAIYWTAATGARVSSGPIRDAWAAQGWETGPLGYPTTDIRTASNGAQSQGYQNGAIYWTAATGARVSSGPIRDAWAAQGWETGPLGYPTTDVKTGPNGGQSQGYQNGAIYWTAATGAHSTSGVIRDAWAAQGWETGPLGYPTTDIRTAANGAKSQGYENGAIYWTSTTGAHVSSGVIRDAWAAQGWEAGPLGYPTSDVTAANGGQSQSYQNGAIYWTAATGAHSISGVIRDAWAAQGRETGPLGYPTTNIRTAANGAQSQGYQNGAIYWTSATGARVSSGPIRDAWAAQGWETGPLGYPTTDVRTAANGAQSQGYQNGAIYWTSTTGAQLSPNGPIRNAWAAQGWETGPLGYPTSGQYPTANGNTAQNFQGGRIDSSPTTGTKTTLTR
ncbi:GH25 family lysozyme [Arthrobacter sp. BPSS-3]|uniref:GH25 family lysozyme n=2 Tax=unclassified Arthrobacter TaxID=235627 RepID=UPI0037DBF4E1